MPVCMLIITPDPCGVKDFWRKKCKHSKPWRLRVFDGLVGASGFEPPTSASRTLRASQTALRPANCEDYSIIRTGRKLALAAMQGPCPTI